MGKIYFVELRDYDREEVIGYFTNETDAKICRDYLNLVRPSSYADVGYEWKISAFEKCEYDYATLLEAEKLHLEIIKEAKEKEAEERERALYEQLKLKYGT